MYECRMLRAKEFGKYLVEKFSAEIFSVDNNVKLSETCIVKKVVQMCCVIYRESALVAAT